MADAPEAIQLHLSTPATLGFVDDRASLTAETMLGIGKLKFVATTADRLFREVASGPPPPLRSMVAMGAVEIAWLGPAEWLITGPQTAVSELLRRADDIAGDLGQAVDLTHGRASFLLTGTKVRERLATVTSLDVSRKSFSKGSVARAPLGQTTMFLAHLAGLEELDRFRIIVDQTMASYAARMLAVPPALKMRRGS